MSDQPVIIEDEHIQQKSASGRVTAECQNFFELLDLVEDYDSIAQQIRKQYQQAMLQLANIKFLNPYILTPNSHRCLPAYLRLNSEGSLQQGYSAFNQGVDADQFPDQFQEQKIIEQDCRKKEEEYQKRVSEKNYDFLRNGEVLYRFNILNQQKEVISASNKFYTALQSILKLSKIKERLQSNFKRLESQKSKKNAKER